MTSDILNTVILAMCFLGLFGCAELMYHKLKVHSEITRKIVHTGTGVLTLLFPVMLENHWYVLILCSSFLLLLVLSLRFDLLKSINAIDRTSRGSILYPVSVYLVFLVYNHYDNLFFYYVPILILAISDPIASLTGRSWPYGKYRVFSETKTLVGSTGFFVSALFISFVIMRNSTRLDPENMLLVGVTLGAVSTVVEAISQKGYDNLFIPSSCAGVLILFQETTSIPF